MAHDVLRRAVGRCSDVFGVGGDRGSDVFGDGAGVCSKKRPALLVRVAV